MRTRLLHEIDLDTGTEVAICVFDFDFPGLGGLRFELIEPARIKRGS